MNYMFEAGFLETRAPFFMDFVTIMVVLLPLLVLGAIALAKRKAYKQHATTQGIIFIIAVIVVGYFEYGVRLAGGFDAFMKESNTSHNYALIVLIFHIAIALVSLIIWVKTFISARKATKANELPGSYSQAHKKAGKITFIGIFLTAFTGLWVYVILFVY